MKIALVALAVTEASISLGRNPTVAFLGNIAVPLQNDGKGPEQGTEFGNNVSVKHRPRNKSAAAVAGDVVHIASHSLHDINETAARSNETISTFPAVYDSYSDGRGVWKWNTYLQLYQRHFAMLANRPLRLLEIGVQSGGSINLFKAVLGSQCHYYGMDINTNCRQFQDATTTIYIGDQASIPAWTHFFSNFTARLDIVIDDGGHQAHQMLTTLQQVLPHLSPGGILATEDIHGVNDDYLSKFFLPAADFLGQNAANLLSVHIYPFVLLAQKIGGTPYYHSEVYHSIAAPVQIVQTFEELSAAMPLHLGKTVALQNPAWPLLFTAPILRALFTHFYDLHGGTVTEQPPHCHDDSTSANCTMIASNTAMQNLIEGVHIYPKFVLVEVAASMPSIFAKRKGTVWIPYAGP